MYVVLMIVQRKTLGLGSKRKLLDTSEKFDYCIKQNVFIKKSTNSEDVPVASVARSDF